MGRQGPCFHCGIEHTILWRRGPLENENLCNACGSWWRTNGTLENYVPKHGISPSKKNLHSDEKKVMPVEEDTNSEITNPTAESGFPLSMRVPKRKRSVLPQYCLTHIGRLHRQLLQIQHEQETAPKISSSGEEGNDLLIDNTSWLISSNETALGAVLLK